MTKGTASQRGGKIVHQRCRRCGKHSYHRQHGRCASCGFGETARWRSYHWAKLKY